MPPEGNILYLVTHLKTKNIIYIVAPSRELATQAAGTYFNAADGDEIKLAMLAGTYDGLPGLLVHESAASGGQDFDLENPQALEQLLKELWDVADDHDSGSTLLN